MKKLQLLSAVCTAALYAGPLLAEGDAELTRLETWDSDSDRMVTQEEWAAAIDEHGLFDKIDRNNNGNFDVEESLDEVLDYDLAMDLDDGGHEVQILIAGTEVPIGEEFTLATRKHEGQYRLVVQLGETEL